MIEQLCLDKIISWRGDEDDANKMDDILREVIVIDDDDDDDEDDDAGAGDKTNHQQNISASPCKDLERDSSIEIIPATALRSQAIDYRKFGRARGSDRLDSPDIDMDGEPSHSARQPLYRRQGPQIDQENHERQEKERHRRYEEALDRRRKRSKPLYLAGDADVSITYNRVSGKELKYANEIQPRGLYRTHSQDRMIGVREDQSSPRVASTDDYAILREDRRGQIEQVSLDECRIRTESVQVLSDGKCPFRVPILKQRRTYTPYDSIGRSLYKKWPNRFLPVILRMRAAVPGKASTKSSLTYCQKQSLTTRNPLQDPSILCTTPLMPPVPMNPEPGRASLLTWPCPLSKGDSQALRSRKLRPMIIFVRRILPD